MAKITRRKRRHLQEREERKIRTHAKAGEPFSRHRIKTCCHYTAFGGTGLPVHASSYLIKQDENMYKCSVCGKVFNSEQARNLEVLCDYLKSAITISSSTVRELLTEDILPTKYYYTAPNEVVYCGTEVVVPRIGGLWTE